MPDVEDGENDSAPDLTGLSSVSRLAMQITHSFNLVDGILSPDLVNAIKYLGKVLPASIHVKEVDKLNYIAGNDAFMELYGLKHPEDFLNKSIFDMALKMKKRWPADKACEIQQSEEKIIEKNQALVGVDESYLDKNGFVIVNSLNKLPLHDKNNNVCGILTIAISQEKLLKKSAVRQLYGRLYGNKKQALKFFLLHFGLTRFSGISPYQAITDRELDCLILLSLGKTIKEIGLRLNISYRTVEVHIDHIKKKCHFNSTADMINEFSMHYFDI